MEKLIIASNNKGKIKEIKSILGNHFQLLSLADVGINIDVAETGETFFENALIKAKAIYDLSGLCALSDDSGLCVDELNGAPGVYSARYSGENATDKSNNEKLLKAMQKIENRDAKFVSSVVLYFGDNNYVEGNGEVKGKILFKPSSGENGFGYDPLFYSYELEKTFADATADEKNSISHRGRALADLVKKLDKISGQ